MRSSYKGINYLVSNKFLKKMFFNPPHEFRFYRLSYYLYQISFPFTLFLYRGNRFENFTFSKRHLQYKLGEFVCTRKLLEFRKDPSKKVSLNNKKKKKK